MTKLNGVFIIPTGLGCTLGGDAAFNTGVKLMAECVNNLIINPNSVNASDINEMPSNCLYVEGSTIDRFLQNKLNLEKIKTYNKILLAVNSPVTPMEINTMNAGIWGLGANIEMVELNTPLTMKATFNSDGTAGGEYSGIDELVNQLQHYNYDALALQTFIECDKNVSENYWKNGGTNPWGGIEAIVSKKIAERINKPIAHGPKNDTIDVNLVNNIAVNMSMAPEVISMTYMFCVFKGLHRAPRLVFDLSKTSSNIISSSDIDVLITPHGCWGNPHIACNEKNIPIIVVNENKTCFSNNFIYNDTKNIIFVNNYLEAAGVIMAMSCGVDYKTIKG